MAISTGAALLGSAAIGVGGSLLAGGQQSKSIGRGIDSQERMFERGLELTGPQRESGYSALNALSSGFIPGYEGMTLPDGTQLDPITQQALEQMFQNTPGNEFIVNESMRNLGNSFASRGGAFGGNALRGATDRLHGLNEGRANMGLNMLSNIAGIGGTAAGQGAASASQVGANLGNLYTQQGGARASGIAGAGNALSGGLNDMMMMNMAQKMGLFA